MIINQGDVMEERVDISMCISYCGVRFTLKDTPYLPAVLFYIILFLFTKFVSKSYCLCCVSKVFRFPIKF